MSERTSLYLIIYNVIIVRSTTYIFLFMSFSNAINLCIFLLAYNPQCPENSVYSHDMPCTKSCADPQGFTCLEQPMGGCHCEEGFYQDGDAALTCVPFHLCGCMDGDMYYPVWLSLFYSHLIISSFILIFL